MDNFWVSAANEPATFLLSHKPLLLTSLGVLLILIVAYLYTQAFLTDIAPIKGIPEAPGSVPFFGHLQVLGLDHPSKFEEWGTENNWPIVQARLGRRRVLVLNGFKEAQEWIVKNASATIDRPLFYTFHTIISKSQGLSTVCTIFDTNLYHSLLFLGGTIGTSPWDESSKRRRTAVSAYLTRPALRASASTLDVESHALVEDLLKATKEDPLGEVDPLVYCQRIAFNITLMICYGTRFSDAHDPDLLTMLNIATTVARY